jgi:hypothetical protein
MALLWRLLVKMLCLLLLLLWLKRLWLRSSLMLNLWLLLLLRKRRLLLLRGQLVWHRRHCHLLMLYLLRLSGTRGRRVHVMIDLIEVDKSVLWLCGTRNWLTGGLILHLLWLTRRLLLYCLTILCLLSRGFDLSLRLIGITLSLLRRLLHRLKGRLLLLLWHHLLRLILELLCGSRWGLSSGSGSWCSASLLLLRKAFGLLRLQPNIHRKLLQTRFQRVHVIVCLK